MKSCSNFFKKNFPLFLSLLSGLIFFNIMFTLIRKYYYGEMPILQEYVFPLIMGTLFGGGIGLWHVQNAEYKKEIERTLSDLKKSNDLLSKTNRELSCTQKKLDQAQKMELIGIIAGSVAHDLNNVLAATVNYPEILLLEYPENSSLCNDLETIKKSGMKAAAMVQDLLTLARRGVHVEEVVNLNHIVDECIASPEFKKIIKYHSDVRLKLNLEKNLHNIIGSPFHLIKTIINLVSNAAEAMPQGGTLTIQSYNCVLDNPVKTSETIPAGTYSVLSIQDTGIGIPKEDIQKIFEPFYTKKKMGRSGTGLGMTVVWGTVKDHDGTIDVRSFEEQGTTFYLYFPITDQKIKVTKTYNIQYKSIDDYRGNGELILVVDDVEEQRKIAKDLLSVLGYSVITASDGEKAVEYLKKCKPALVLMDMVMSPNIDGVDTYKKMLNYNPHQKSLIVSGYAENSRVRKMIQLGAGKYIKKPYTLEMLGDAIKNELRKN